MTSDRITVPLPTLQELAWVLRKHWLKAAVAFIATVATVGIGTLLATPIYQSTSVLLVRLGREYLYQPAIGDRQAVINRDPEAVINNEIEILRSTDLIRDVVAQLGETNLYPDLAEQESSDFQPLIEAEKRFQKSYMAQALPESSVIRLSFRHPDPEMVARALNLLVDLFREKHLETFGNPRATAFLEEQVAAYRAKLEESERRLNDFLQASPSTASGQLGENLLLTQHQSLETVLKQTQSRIEGLAEQLRFLNAEKSDAAGREGAGARAQENRAIEDAKMRLLNLQLEEQELLGRFNESSRPVVNVRQQIEAARRFLEEQEAVIGEGGAFEDLEERIIETEGELRYEQARLASLRRQLADLTATLTAFPVEQARYRDLARERDVQEENYRTYLKKLEDARIAAEMDRQKIADISVIQKARVPTRPISPRKRLNLAVGIVLGTALGLGVAFLAEIAAVRRPLSA